MRWTLVLVSAALACAPPPTDDSRALVRIAGSESMTTDLLPRLVAAWAPSADVRFEVTGGGSRAGIRALLDGRADVAASSRLPTPAENDQAKAYGWSFERHLVGLNVVALSVHPQNPLQSLTWDQARDIFCTGAVRDWGELGLEPRPIRVLVPDEQSGSREAFEDFFCGIDGIARRHEMVDTATQRAQLVADPAVVTFSPLSDRSGKVLSLRSRPDAAAVAPTQANAIRGRYPLVHDLALYTAGPPNPEIRGFLDWIESPAGQHEVDGAWVVPLYLRAALLEGPRPLRETITFDEGSVTPDDRSSARIDVLIEELRNRAGEINHVVLEGYADPGERDRLTLSYERVATVRERLANALPSLFFEIIPRGDHTHLAPTDTPRGRAMNRSVRVYFGEEEASQAIAVSADTEAAAAGD